MSYDWSGNDDWSSLCLIRVKIPCFTFSIKHASSCYPKMRSFRGVFRKASCGEANFCSWNGGVFSFSEHPTGSEFDHRMRLLFSVLISTRPAKDLGRGGLPYGELSSSVAASLSFFYSDNSY